jgi:hypothetical protein
METICFSHIKDNYQCNVLAFLMNEKIRVISGYYFLSQRMKEREMLWCGRHTFIASQTNFSLVTNKLFFFIAKSKKLCKTMLRLYVTFKIWLCNMVLH